MKARLRVLLQELDRPDLDEAGKATVQAEIERLLGAHARQIYQVLPGETDPRLKDLLTVTAHEPG